MGTHENQIEELENRMAEMEGKLRQYEAQGRLLLSLGLAVTGFVGWMWGDQIKIFLHRIFG